MGWHTGGMLTTPALVNVCDPSAQIHPSAGRSEQPQGSRGSVPSNARVGRIVYHSSQRISLPAPVPITNQKGSHWGFLCTKQGAGAANLNFNCPAGVQVSVCPL